LKSRYIFIADYLLYTLTHQLDMPHTHIYTIRAHTLWDDRRHSSGRTEGPGLPSVILDDASAREGCVSIANTAMQSPGSIASQVLIAASHVSSLS
jgi:hypothetical protein